MIVVQLWIDTLANGGQSGPSNTYLSGLMYTISSFVQEPVEMVNALRAEYRASAQWY